MKWILVITIKNTAEVTISTFEFTSHNDVLRWLTKYIPERIHAYHVTQSNI